METGPQKFELGLNPLITNLRAHIDNAERFAGQAGTLMDRAERLMDRTSLSTPPMDDSVDTILAGAYQALAECGAAAQSAAELYASFLKNQTLPEATNAMIKETINHLRHSADAASARLEALNARRGA